MVVNEVNEDVEREKFEEWCMARYQEGRPRTAVNYDGDIYYEEMTIDCAWMGWIARASQNKE